MKIRFMKLSSALAALTIAATASILSHSSSVADEYEWDPSSGYHEEEWYDPSDWANDDGRVDYENDYFGSYYDGDAVDDESWYGNNYYTDDWFGDEADFDGWYDDGDADLNINENEYGADEYEEAGN